MTAPPWVVSGSVDDALAFFPELEPHLGKRTGLLSGGQQQMLALGRILAAKPRIILADELSLGLAPLVVRRLLTALRQAAENGAAVLVVEQTRTCRASGGRPGECAHPRADRHDREGGPPSREPHAITDRYFASA